MRPDQLLRLARRHAGLSQRALAQRAGLAVGTVAGAETGRPLSTETLRTLLAACDLELAVMPRCDTRPTAEHREHLRRSTVQRLRGAVGDDWPALVELARAGEVLLTGTAAVAVWVPGVVAEGPPAVPDVGALRLATVGLQVAHGAVVQVPPPAELLLDPSVAVHWPALRAAAELLDVEGGRDKGGRRAPAHRDPDDDADSTWLVLSWVVYCGGRVSRLLPDGRDGRGWRLDSPVSLVQDLERRGLPVPPGRERRFRPTG